MSIAPRTTRPGLPTAALNRAAGMPVDLPELRPIQRDPRTLSVVSNSGNIPLVVWLGIFAIGLFVSTARERR